MALIIGQILRSRYQIQRLLGQGGFGAVYQAMDLNLQRVVAVKENLDASVAAQRQFQREAQMLAPIRHQHLPQILDYFIETNGWQYLVMEFVAGSTLRQLVQQNGALAEVQALVWANQILDALNELHSNNPPIIHRDIKPDNIIITPRGNAMLVDFGIAKAAHPGMPTTTGARAVSPSFSPPEQYGNAPTDARSDMYAFGATLYYVLTGIEPPESIQRIITNTPLIPPRQYNARISQHVENTIVKAMEINPAQRHQTSSQVSQALTQPRAYPSYTPPQPSIPAYTPTAPVQPVVSAYAPAPQAKVKPAPASSQVSANWREYMVKPIAIGLGLSAALTVITYTMPVAFFPLAIAGLGAYLALGAFVARENCRANNDSLETGELFRVAIFAGSIYGVISSVLQWILGLLGLGLVVPGAFLGFFIPFYITSLIGIAMNLIASVVLFLLGGLGYRLFTGK